MSTTALALIGYAAWSLALVTSIGAMRAAAVMRGRAGGNAFAVDGTDMSPFATRLARVHANCYENLPAFAALALTAIATGNHAVTDPLALWVLFARLGQSLVHLASTAPLAINARFGFFLVQVTIEVYWVIALLGLAS